jgi:predicted aspartyl protease
MICPKCGFDQPDDIYCAFCGVDIERHLQQRKKKRVSLYVVIALVGIVGASVAKFISSEDGAKAPLTAVRHAETKSTVQTEQVTPTKVELGRPASEIQPRVRAETARVPTLPPQDVSFQPAEDERERAGGVKPGGALPSDTSGAGSAEKMEVETLTSVQWFEKGKALDDESEAEIECYQRAIALDPGFAAAYYRLGAIYHRRAHFDLADQEFAKFLKHASEADRQAYSIYVYYSPSDVERLSEEEEAKLASPEETKEEALLKSEEGTTETPSVTEEAERDTGEVTEGAEERTASEPEAAQEEAEFEIEGEEEEEPADYEKENGESIGGESEQELGEEVMTVVQFSAVDGHVMVPVVFNGFLEASVLVDTGSSITVLSSELAEKLELAGQWGHAITLRTMGVDIEAQWAVLKSIQVGDLIEQDFPVAITDLRLGGNGKFEAILGMDFMKNYTMRIDNVNRRLVLSPGKKIRTQF